MGIDGAELKRQKEIVNRKQENNKQDEKSYDDQKSAFQRKKYISPWGALALVVIAIVASGVVYKAISENSDIPPPPLNTFIELDDMNYVGKDVVFVKKDIYGGDLAHNAILRGTIRNIGSRGIANIYIVWAIYDEKHLLYDIRYSSQNMKSLFVDKVNYLDAKSEVSFNIDIDLYRRASSESARMMRNSLIRGQEISGIFVKNSHNKEDRTN